MKINTFHVGIIDTNCYVLTDEKTHDSLIVDPGDVSKELLDFIKDKNIKYILLTHGHYDHILGVAKLKKIIDAPVLISEQDAPCLYDDNLSRAGLHFPEKQESVTPDRLLNDGDIIPFGNTEIKVMHTPGHTVGCVCYILAENNIIFTGDTLFKLSMGRTDFKGGSDFEMMKSLSKLAALNGDFSVFPGHGDSTTLNFERQYNPYMRNLI